MKTVFDLRKCLRREQLECGAALSLCHRWQQRDSVSASLSGRRRRRGRPGPQLWAAALGRSPGPLMKRAWRDVSGRRQMSHFCWTRSRNGDLIRAASRAAMSLFHMWWISQSTDDSHVRGFTGFNITLTAPFLQITTEKNCFFRGGSVNKKIIIIKIKLRDFAVKSSGWIRFYQFFSSYWNLHDLFKWFFLHV